MQRFAYKRKSSLGIGLVIAIVLLLAVPMVAVAQDITDEESAFISVRRYDGIDPGDMAEIESIAREGFVPILHASDGFIAYYVTFTDADVLVAVNVFETRDQALASNEMARDFVVESLAPYLPNPPQIVEGSIDIGFVEMLHGMSDGDVDSLHTSVRIYDGFDTDSLSAFVSIVDEGFLPLMRETDGFFGYYLMNDGAGMVVAISIFDSAESALASTVKARDFVAENLAAFLPNDPLITEGRVGIAVLSDVNEGANLIDDMMEEHPIFVSIRVYDGVDASDRDEIVRLADEGFLPIMRESDGFVAYYLLPAGDMVAAISLFETAEQASASAEAAREFVAEFMVPLLPNVPLIIEGRVDVSTQMLIKVHDPDDLIGPLYGALRIYDNYDMSRLDDANELVETILVPSLQEAGVFSYVSMNDGDDHVVGLSVFGSEESALAANNIAASFVAEHLADWLPNDPMRINGRMSVVARAEILMGENLAEWTMMDADMESQE